MRATTAALPASFERRDGLVYFVAPEPEPTAQEIEDFFDGLAILEKQAAAHGEVPPYRLLVDCASMQRLGAAARAVTYRRKREVAPWRIAVVGHTVFQRMVVEFLRIATGVRGVKYFTDESKAREWLGHGGT